MSDISESKLLFSLDMPRLWEVHSRDLGCLRKKSFIPSEVAESYLPSMTVFFEFLEGMKIAKLHRNHMAQTLLSQNLIPESLEKMGCATYRIHNTVRCMS